MWSALQLLGLGVVVAWLGYRIPRVGRRRRWGDAVRRLGLAPSRERNSASGRFRGYQLTVSWTEKDRATLVLHGPGPVDAAAVRTVRDQLATQVTLGIACLPDCDYHWRFADGEEIARAGAQALAHAASEQGAWLPFEIECLAGNEVGCLADAASLAVWIAKSLDWSPSWADDAPPDPGIPLESWLDRLGGWAPSGLVANGALIGRLQIARAAARSADRWISALGALHSGVEGVPALVRLIRDPETPDKLVLWVLPGARDALTRADWITLLHRCDPVAIKATEALAVVGDSGVLEDLRQMSTRKRPVKNAAWAAIDAIVDRGDLDSGRVSVADRIRGRLSDLHAQAGQLS